MEIKQYLTDPYTTRTKMAVELALQTRQCYSDGTCNTGTLYMPCMSYGGQPYRYPQQTYSKQTYCTC